LAVSDDCFLSCAAEAAAGANDSGPRFSEIAAAWEAAREKYVSAFVKAKTPREQSVMAASAPDYRAYSQQMLDLAESQPNSQDARDASLWLVELAGQASREDRELNPFESRAVMLLLAYHSEDPEVARRGLEWHNRPSRQREALLSSIVKKARTFETQGLARFALAQYLLNKATLAESAIRLNDEEGTGSRGDADYWKYLESCNVGATRRQAETLLEETIAEFGEIPFVRANERLKQFDQRRARNLAQTAEALLDEARNLAVGKPAPEIEGADLDGQTRKLSGFRGKIVVLIFWASWCGPCLDEIPHERDLAERFKDRPFAILGINCDQDLAAARKTIETEKVAWPNWSDPFTDAGPGPISERFHIHGFPSTFVLDGTGTIRAKNARGEALHKQVESLLGELESR
jgi:peroxiredoxin